MDLELVKRGLDLSRRKKKWIILMGLFGLSSYGAYKIYNLPYVERKRRRLLKLLGAFLSVAEIASDSADAIGVVSKDLKEFLQSDSDEIPTSLKQLSKMVRSDEFLKSLSRVAEAMAVGVLRGYSIENHQDQIEEVKRSDFTDRVMDKLMSSAGTGFASAIVGSFAKNLVLGFYANAPGERKGNDQAACERSNSSPLDGWIDLMCDDKCRGLMADCIQNFVSTAVAVYLDKTMSINFYDEVFSALTNHKHEGKVSDLLVSLCNGAVETLVKTSHHVLTTSKSDPGSSTNAPSKSDSISLLTGKLFDQEDVPLRKMKEAKGNSNFQGSGWVNSVSSTLAVPSNRRFVLDVTGRVTSESMRSLVEFVYWKISEGLKSSVSTVREDATEKGREVIRFVGAKSCVILTICLALVLHLLGGTRALLPA